MKLHIAAIIVFALIFTSGCSSIHSDTTGTTSQKNRQQINIDSACSYSHFLSGSHMENSSDFAGAQEAYEKALECDPSSTTVLEKLPILLIKMGKIQEATVWLQKSLEKAPEQNGPRLLLARLAVRSGDSDEAIRLFNEALEVEPDNHSILLNLGINHIRALDYIQAKKSFIDLVKLSPESYFGNLYLARLYAQTNDIQQASELYDTAILLTWSNQLAFEIAEFHMRSQKPEKALHFYNTILKTDEENIQAGLGLIQTFLALQQYDKGLLQLNEMQKFSAKSDRLDLLKSRIYLQNQQPSKAINVLTGLINGDLASEAKYMLAVIYFQQKKYPKGLDSLDSIVPSDKEFKDSVYLKVRILQQQKKNDAAHGYLEKILAEPATRHPLFYALLASLYMDSDQINKAKTSMDTGISFYPDNEQLYFEKGLLLERTGDYELAVETMQKVLTLQPDHPEALNYIGYTWADKNINLQKAKEMILQAIALKPDSGYIRDSLGWIHYRLGNFDRARTELKKALEQEPGDPHIYDHLADVYRSIGDIDNALKSYKKALELFSNEEKKTVVQDKINKLSS